MYNVSERMKEERASQLQWENDVRVRCKLRICVVFSVVAGYELCVRTLTRKDCTLTGEDSTINMKSYLP